MITGRQAFGAILLLSLGWLVVAVAAGVRWEYRDRSGLAEAETGLDAILNGVETSFAESHRLCPSSNLSLAHGFYARDYLGEVERALVDDERRRDAGFYCLRVPYRQASFRERDMFSYESDGTHFRARAFRAYLYDPDGVLPRYEVEGDVIDGKLHVDRHVRRIEPGGRKFLGHPDHLEY